MDVTQDLTPKQTRFLRCFEACASVTQAARWAKIQRRTHYDWLDAHEHYRVAFERAEKVAGRTLEDEAVRRAHEGLRKAVRYKGRIVGWESEYSDSLMLALLKGFLPEKYRERSEVKMNAQVGISDLTAVKTEVQKAVKLMPAELQRDLAAKLLASDGTED